MAELEAAVAEMNAEVDACAAVVLRIDELLERGANGAIDESLDRIETAVQRLQDREAILGSLEDEADGVGEFLFSQETSEELRELENKIGELEQAFASLETRITETAASAESFTQMQEEKGEELSGHLADGREKLDDAFTALTEAVTAAHEEALSTARDAFEKSVSALTETVREQFQERPAGIVENAGQSLTEKLNGVEQSLEEAIQSLTAQAEEALAQLERHASDGVRRAVEEEVAALIDSAVEALAREALESVAFSQISVAATSALSPILPQLIAVRVIVNALKHALEVMRMGL